MLSLKGVPKWGKPATLTGLMNTRTLHQDLGRHFSRHSQDKSCIGGWRDQKSSFVTKIDRAEDGSHTVNVDLDLTVA